MQHAFPDVELRVERGKVAGEFRSDLDPEALIDAIFGALYFRFLLRMAPLTDRYGQELVDQVLRGARPGAVGSS